MKLIIILVGVTAYVQSKSKQFAGPFEVLLKQPFVCEDEGKKELYFNETIVRKKSKNSYTVTSKIYVAIPFGDEVQLKANFAVWGNGGWRPNFLTLDYGPGCTSFSQLLPGIFEGLFKQNNLTSCPIPPGEYIVEDLDGSPKVNIPSLPYNKYKVYLMAYKDNFLVGCLGFITEVVPKEKKS